MCEGSFLEELEEGLIAGLHQTQSELQLLNLKFDSELEEDPSLEQNEFQEDGVEISVIGM